MTPEQVFLICNYGVLPAWLLLALAPGWSWTERIVHRVWIPALLALVYAWAFATSPGTPEDGGFGSLAGVMAMFAVPHVALAGWGITWPSTCSWARGRCATPADTASTTVG